MKKRFLQIGCVVLILATIVVLLVFRNATKADAGTYQDDIGNLQPNEIVLPDSHAKVSFADVILSAPQETRKLVVLEQEASVTATIQKSKIRDVNWDSLMQNQDVTYKARGQFVVDLDKLTKDCLVDDPDQKVLTIRIDHPYLDAIEIDPSRIEVSGQQNGFLAFGKLALTVDDYVALETELQQKLKNEFDTSTSGQVADDQALAMVGQIYEPVVKAVAPDYSVKVEYK